MPIPPRPAPNHASAEASEGTDRTPPTSAAIGLSATTTIHIAPNDTPRITRYSDAVIHDVRVSIVGVIRRVVSSTDDFAATLRREPERLLEARRVAQPDLRIEHAGDGLAVERREHLIGRNAAHVLARLARDAGRVRTDHHVVHLQQRVIERRRLLLPHVEPCACDLLRP